MTEEVVETGAESDHLTFGEGSLARPDGRATFKHVCNVKVVCHPTNPTRKLENVTCNTDHTGHASIAGILEASEVALDLLEPLFADVSHPPGLDVIVVRANFTTHFECLITECRGTTYDIGIEKSSCTRLCAKGDNVLVRIHTSTSSASGGSAIVATSKHICKCYCSCCHVKKCRKVV